MSHLVLSTQDEQLLIDLHTHIYLDFDYINAHIYPDYHDQSTYNRLQKFAKNGYIRSEFIPIPRKSTDRAGKVFTLDKFGVEVTEELLGEVHWKKQWTDRVPAFAYHSIMLAYIAKEMQRTSDDENLPIEMKEWVNEARAFYQYTSARSDMLRPDAVSVVGKKQHDDHNFGLFLELERSHSKRQTVIKKVRRYNDFMKQGEKAFRGYDEKVLFEHPISSWKLIFIAMDNTRLKRIMRYLQQEKFEHIEIVVTTYDDILNEPFGRIYRSPDDPDTLVTL